MELQQNPEKKWSVETLVKKFVRAEEGLQDGRPYASYECRSCSSALLSTEVILGASQSTKLKYDDYVILAQRLDDEGGRFGQLAQRLNCCDHIICTKCLCCHT